MAYHLAAVLAGSAEDPCCCGPEGCCLYPNPGIISEGDPPSNYPSTDAPDTIRVTAVGPWNSVTDEPFVKTPNVDYSGFYWVGPTLPVIIDGDFIGNYTWIVYPGIGEGVTDWFISDGFGSDWEGPCLIGDYFGGQFIEDEFPDTLTATWTDDSATLSRVSNCCWEGTSDTEGAFVSLCYDSIDFKWEIEITWPDPVPGYANTPGTGGAPKDDPQDTPIGSYPNLGGFDFFPPEVGGVTIA